MKRFLSYIVLAFIFTVQLYCDSFITQPPTADQFPYIEMPFYVRDDNGNFYSGYKESDFLVNENGKNLPSNLVQLICSETQAPVQVLLVVDISTSMGETVEGKPKIEWLKKSIKEFINTIDLSPFSQIGITTFCSLADNLCDFTNDKSKLLAAVDKISTVASSTDFNSAFLANPWGGYQRLIQQPNFNRTIIFLSDGEHSSINGPFDQVNISTKLVSSNIKLYAITISDSYDQSISYLKYIAEQTGGSCASGLSPSALPDKYKALAQEMTKKYNCKLRWLSDLYCDKEPRVTNVKVTYRPLNQSAKHVYVAPEWTVFEVKQDQQTYIFGNPPPDQSTFMDIKITPTPFDMVIYDIFLTDKQYFEIVDWGDGTGQKPQAYINLPANKELTIKVKFTQKVAFLPRKSILNIIGYPCNAQIPLYGGDIKIILEKPLASDVFTSCDSINIKWSGTTEAAIKELYYHFDTEPWTLIAKDLIGFNYTWIPPHRDGKCQIKVIAYPFPNSDETVSDISENFTIIKPEIRALYSPLKHDTVLIGLTSKKNYIDLIANKKSEPIKIISWLFTGKAASEFAVESIEKETLAQNDTSDVEIAFTPTLDGPRTATLILVPECGDSLKIDITGWGKCNTEALDSINFGSVVIDELRDSLITHVFYNPMNKFVNITPYLSGVNKNQFEMVGLTGKEKIAVPPFGYYDIEIKFKPTSYGLKTAILNFGVEGCFNKAAILSGFGEYKGLTVNKLDFGRKRYKATFDTLNLIISNKDKFFKKITEINVIKHSTNYKILNLTFPIDIQGFEEKTLKVVFEPLTADTFNTKVLIITSDLDTLDSEFKGMSYLPELKMVSNCPSTLNVGESGIATIWLYNYSLTEPLRIAVCSIIDNPYEFNWINGQPTSLIIPTQDSLILQLDYHPQAGGKHRCIIEILADNYNGTYKKSWFVNNLDIICDAMTFNYTTPIFGTLMICDNQETDFTITNSSYGLDLDVYLNLAQFTGIDKDAFSLIDNDPLLISGGETKNVKIRFDAKHNGLHKAHLNVPNSSNMLVDIDLLANAKMNVQYATPKTKTYIPGEWSNVIFGLDIPEIDKQYIDSLKIFFTWNSDVLHINPLSFKQLISSDKSQSEYLLLDSVSYSDGKVEFVYHCRLLTNKKHELFSYDFMSLLGNSDSTSITMNINYECKNESKIVSFFEMGNYCVQEIRGVLIKALANYMNGPFPNPAKGEIRVEFGLEKESSVIISVYNIEGKLVKTLLNKSYKSGNYEKIFDIRDLSPGNYILKYSTSNYQFSKRFVVEL